MADGSSLPPQRPTVIPGVGQFISSVEGVGESALSLSNRLTFARASTSNTDGSDIRIVRNANYSGDAPWRGFVNSALAVTTTVSPGTTSFEWAGNFILDNFGTSADGSENVALAWSAIKHSSGRSLAGFGQITDLSGPDPVTTSVVTEFDIYANGTDVHENRIFLDLQNYAASPGKGGTGEPGTASHGVRLISADGSPITHGFTAADGVYHCFHGRGTAVGGVLLDDTGNRAIGVNLSGATYSGVAMALAQGQAIAFDFAGESYHRSLSVKPGGFLTYTTGKGSVFGVDDNGNAYCANNFSSMVKITCGVISPKLYGDPVTPVDGDVWYNTTTKTLRCFIGGAMKTIATE
jgi:hypothetical protein